MAFKFKESFSTSRLQLRNLWTSGETTHIYWEICDLLAETQFRMDAGPRWLLNENMLFREPLWVKQTQKKAGWLRGVTSRGYCPHTTLAVTRHHNSEWSTPCHHPLVSDTSSRLCVQDYIGEGGPLKPWSMQGLAWAWNGIGRQYRPWNNCMADGAHQTQGNKPGHHILH